MKSLAVMLPRLATMNCLEFLLSIEPNIIRNPIIEFSTFMTAAARTDLNSIFPPDFCQK